jgi:hypothetical protein
MLVPLLAAVLLVDTAPDALNLARLACYEPDANYSARRGFEPNAGFVAQAGFIAHASFIATANFDATAGFRANAGLIRIEPVFPDLPALIPGLAGEEGWFPDAAGPRKKPLARLETASPDRVLAERAVVMRLRALARARAVVRMAEESGDRRAAALARREAEREATLLCRAEVRAKTLLDRSVARARAASHAAALRAR